MFWHGERRGTPFEQVARQSKAYHERIAESVPGPTTEALTRVAVELGVHVSFGLAERAGPTIFNSQALLSPGGQILDVHRKPRCASPGLGGNETGLSPS